MPSDLQVDNIKDGSATKTLAEYSSSAWSWGTPPAGTVLQVVHNSVQETNTLDTTYKAYWSPSITLKSASSDVICIHASNPDITTGAGFGYRVYRNTSEYASGEATTPGSLVYDENVTDGVGPWTWYNSTGGGMVTQASIYFKDTLSGYSVNDTLYYGFYLRKYDGDAVVVPVNSSTTDGFFQTIFFEVQK